MAAAAAAPPHLMDELIELCLLRLPPDDDPGNLVRAALVCKGWRRIVTDHGFRRRFRELHGRPLMLGFLHVHMRYVSFFTPTSSFRALKRNINNYLHLGRWHAIDFRHGRVLVSSSPSLYRTSNGRSSSDLAVWDPVSGDHLDLPKPPPPPQHPGWLRFTSEAAVLCASSSSGYDHLDCHRGHFLVVLMHATSHGVDVYVYSSQAGAWSHQASSVFGPSLRDLIHRQPVTMTGNALYFIVQKWATNGIVKYDMGTHEVSCVEHLPPDCSSRTCRIRLTTTDSTEHGGLGIVRVENNSRLHLWSREPAGPNGLFGWVESGVIELETVLPANSGSISTVSFVQGLGALFIMTENVGAFAVDLESSRLRKMVCGKSGVNYFVPFTSPAAALPLQGEGPTAGVPIVHE